MGTMEVMVSPPNVGEAQALESESGKETYHREWLLKSLNRRLKRT